MKPFWILPLVLIGCASAPAHHHSILPQDKPITVVPQQIASGFSSPFIWRCEQQEVNPALVWIECNFKNLSNPDPTNPWISAPPCIDVGYYEEKTGKLVVASRKLCAGFLSCGEEKQLYVAFRNEDRAKLNQKCGPTLSECVMLTHRYDEIYGTGYEDNQ
jgi:hypothetical protein